MNPLSPTLRWLAASVSTLVLPWLASAHPGHDHNDIPSVIRHPLAGVEHVVIVVALLLGAAGALVLTVKARRASSDHGARPRTVRLR